jgi:hypothetical protein
MYDVGQRCVALLAHYLIFCTVQKIYKTALVATPFNNLIKYRCLFSK